MRWNISTFLINLLNYIVNDIFRKTVWFYYWSFFLMARCYIIKTVWFLCSAMEAENNISRQRFSAVRTYQPLAFFFGLKVCNTIVAIPLFFWNDLSTSGAELRAWLFCSAFYAEFAAYIHRFATFWTNLPCGCDWSLYVFHVYFPFL